ncbi:O-antigen ligase family protein [Chitinophaga nivalis]|uniref:O-antigen ligase family protein n=1 Tax=Chitinophaga nivalis TaxID=2991709 RepID=A0ABT3IMG6_9BACT|nr:O-antigen ligase family protein [Chitinophaga nivalis]MCW3465333.1 O-antigen ligase family protein [Chitinophaga nivalis]MCW3484975.1 O-antigen ligase family protein [Chitinophaga nivalis]
MNILLTLKFAYPLLLIFLLLSTGYKRRRTSPSPARKAVFSQLDVLALCWILFTGGNMYFKATVPLQPADFYQLFLLSTLYATARYVFATGANVSMVWITLLMTVAVEVCTGLGQALQLYKHTDPLIKIAGSLMNPVTYANYLLSVLPVSLYIALSPTTFRAGWRYLAGSASILLILIPCCLMASRMAWIVTALIMLLTFRLLRRKPLIQPATRSIHGLLPVLLPLLAGGLFYWLLQLKTASTVGRYFILQNTLQLLHTHFISGIGFGNFNSCYNDFQANYFRTHSDPAMEYLAAFHLNAGNEYLQIALEGGIAAILLIILTLVKIVQIIQKNYRHRQPAVLTGIISIVAILVMACFSYPFRIVPVMAHFIMAMAILSSVDRSYVFPFSTARIYFYPLSSLALILLTAGILRFNSYLRWQIIMQQYADTATPPAACEVKRLYSTLWPALKHHPAFLADYAEKLSQAADYPGALALLQYAIKQSGYYFFYQDIGQVYETLKNAPMAEQAYLKACYLVPGKLYPRYQLMLFYYHNQDTVQAAKWAAIINKMQVKVADQQVATIKHQAREILAGYKSRP